VRYRIDGVCHEYARLPGPFARPIVARIKIMAGLDIAERRLPQDGKILLRKFGPLDVEIRVATLPTAGGNEDVVMRLLNPSLPVKVDNLGMQPEILERFKQVISEPYGIVLCVGPTGAGKTTTLHAGLAYLNKPDKKIWTAEDPVEITQHGLRQVQVQPKIGLTFERALRSFLRADPDVIMIGEMRDLETATAAVEASLTGHMVFSTLHTNNAPETVTRLLDLGLDAFAFGDSLRGVLAQRLVRKLCVDCRRVQAPTAAEIAYLQKEFGRAEGALKKVSKLYKPGSCEKCNQTGYRGRVAVTELLVVDDEIRQLIYKKANAGEIRKAALAQGMLTLKQDGIFKVCAGLTDYDEVRSSCM